MYTHVVWNQTELPRRSVCAGVVVVGVKEVKTTERRENVH